MQEQQIERGPKTKGQLFVQGRPPRKYHQNKMQRQNFKHRDSQTAVGLNGEQLPHSFRKWKQVKNKDSHTSRQASDLSCISMTSPKLLEISDGGQVSAGPRPQTRTKEAWLSYLDSKQKADRDRIDCLVDLQCKQPNGPAANFITKKAGN